MKQSILLALTAIILTSCGGNGKKATADNTNTPQVAETSTVYVYYFHVKERCKTCIAVGDITKGTIESAFAGNENVRFIEIETSDKNYEALVEKYEVTWNALIIAKGDKSENLTEQAFATALNNPLQLTENIKSTINSML